MSGQALVVIPARYDSHRLPGKATADICGVPMVVRVASATWGDLGSVFLRNRYRR